MSRRGVSRTVAVEIDPGELAAGRGAEAGSLARTVDRTLTTSVRLSGKAGPVTRLRHLDLQQLAALEVSGGPMQLRNDLCTPGAVFIFLLVAGDCTIRCEAGEVRLRAGQFTLLRGDRTVQALHTEAFQVRGTRLPAAQLEGEMAGWMSAELLPIDTASGAGQLLYQLQDVLLAAGAELTNRSADAYARALASVLADAVRGVLPNAGELPGQTQAEHHKRRIRAHVRAHLADPLLDVAGVAAGVALSIGHVHRLFANEPLSLAAWIQAERLDACHAALLAGIGHDRTLTELALSWGFRDPAHFSRSFRRRFAVTPSTLRQRVAGLSFKPMPQVDGTSR